MKLQTILAVSLAGMVGGCNGADEPGGGPAPESAAAAEPTPVLGTFRPGQPIDSGPEGRLPGQGDLAAYIPATALFPGGARIDPEVTNPLAGDPEAVKAGERHFAAFNCVGCHAPLGGGGMGPPLSDEAWIYGDEPAQIYLSILHGRPEGMPAWGSMLPQRTIWELVAYVKTLPQVENPAARLGFDRPEGR